MESTEKHIDAEKLRSLYERTGLTVKQFGRFFDIMERAMYFALGGSGLQSEKRVAQYEAVSRVTAELEREAIEELTPLVAFNSPRLKELVGRKFLSSEKGASPFRKLATAAAGPRAQKIQFNSYDIFKEGYRSN